MIEAIRNLMFFQIGLIGKSEVAATTAAVLFDCLFAYTLITVVSERKPTSADKWILIGCAVVISMLVAEFTELPL